MRHKPPGAGHQYRLVMSAALTERLLLSTVQGRQACHDQNGEGIHRKRDISEWFSARIDGLGKHHVLSNLATCYCSGDCEIS